MIEAPVTRRQQVVNFVEKEARRYVSRRIVSFTSNKDLAERFHYKPGAMDSLTRNTGIITIRKHARERRERDAFPPTLDTAWLLGYLSSSSIMKKTARRTSVINVSEPQAERRKKFKDIIGAYSKSQPQERVRQRKDKTNYEVNVFDAELMRRFGDLSRDNAPRTLKQRYAWIFRDPEITWKFLEGVFEAKGSIRDNGIIFNTSSNAYKDFLIQTLKELGIENPHPIFDDPQKTKLRGVAVQKTLSMKIVSLFISSVDPVSERKLQVLRETERGMKVAKPKLCASDSEEQIDIPIGSEVCVHHWIIESPNGEHSRGTCKKCGSAKEFKNSLDDSEDRSWKEVSKRNKQAERQ